MALETSPIEENSARHSPETMAYPVDVTPEAKDKKLSDMETAEIIPLIQTPREFTSGTAEHTFDDFVKQVDVIAGRVRTGGETMTYDEAEKILSAKDALLKKMYADLGKETMQEIFNPQVSLDKRQQGHGLATIESLKEAIQPFVDIVKKHNEEIAKAKQQTAGAYSSQQKQPETSHSVQNGDPTSLTQEQRARVQGIYGHKKQTLVDRVKGLFGR